MPTRQTLELGLSLSVALLAMATRTAGAAGITRVDGNHENPGELCLVFDEAAQLEEGPASHACSLSLRKRCPVADPLEVFQGDAATGVLSVRDELLGNLVVHIL